MKTAVLRTIPHFLFSSKDVREALEVTAASAKLACHRYAGSGVLVRLKRDLYVLPEKWQNADAVQMYRAANRLQVPSYLSLMTALSFYEISTQIQTGFFESIAITRTKTAEAGGVRFQYTKIQKRLYFGFVKRDGYFMATPEKAFLDALYLISFCRYRLDASSLDMTRFNPSEVRRLSKYFPLRTRELLKKTWKR